jgi:hypothetical protein
MSRPKDDLVDWDENGAEAFVVPLEDESNNKEQPMIKCREGHAMLMAYPGAPYVCATCEEKIGDALQESLGSLTQAQCEDPLMRATVLAACVEFAESMGRRASMALEELDEHSHELPGEQHAATQEALHDSSDPPRSAGPVD